MVMKDNNDESYNENIEQQQLTEGFAINCYKIISPILLQKLVNDLMILNDFKILLLVEDVSQNFGN